jgi:hypothetical protein
MEFNTKKNADKNVADQQAPREMATMSVEDLDLIYGGVYAHKMSRVRATYEAEASKSL